jgi:hypothetical protein
MASSFRLRRSSRDSGTSDRDERVRRENIAAGRGNSTAERKKKFKPSTPKGVVREEMSGRSDAPKPKVAAPKPKAKGPFKLTPKAAPVPTPRPDPITTGATPTPYMYSGPTGPVPGQSMAGTETAPAPSPYMYGGGVTPGQSMAGTETAPHPAPNFLPPMNSALSRASILQTIPPALQTPMGPAPGNSMAGQEFAPRPPLPGPLAQLGGPATSPFTGGPTGPGPGVDQRAMLARMLGLGV